MVIIQKQQKSVNDYKKCNEELMKSSKPCSARDLPCSFRPTVSIAPPR